MATLTQEVVEAQIIKTVNEVARKLNLETVTNCDQLPPSALTSNALLNVMGTISILLGADIPNSCYIFYDKQANRRLPIKEAAKKLIQNATNEK